MQVSRLMSAVVVLGALAGCSRYESKAPPVSTSSSGPPSMMPQSPNSLPLGSAVNAPLTSPTGTIGTTAVGGSPAAAQSGMRR